MSGFQVHHGSVTGNNKTVSEPVSELDNLYRLRGLVSVFVSAMDRRPPTYPTGVHGSLVTLESAAITSLALLDAEIARLEGE